MAAKQKRVSKPAPKPSVPKVSKNESKYLMHLAKQFLDPESVGDAVLAPSEFPTTGDVKKFTRTIELKATSLGGAGSSFAMKLRPTFANTFLLSEGTGVPAAGPVVDLTWSGVISTSQFDAGNHVLCGPLNCTSLNGPVGAIDTTTNGNELSWLIQKPAGAAPVTVSVICGNVYTFTFSYLSGGVWIPFLNGKNAIGIPLIFDGPLPAFDALRIETTSDSQGDSVTVNIEMHGNVSSSPASSSTFSLFNTDAVSLSRVERWRVTSLSLLCSYSGNEFNDGGVIAAARVQPGFSMLGNGYEVINRLPDHSYHGPLKHGSYSWWLPGAYEELDFAPVTSPRPEETSLVAAGVFSDATGSLEITMTAIVEFYSPLQIFSHNYGPAWTPETSSLLHDLNMIPAATCNPDHDDLFRQLVRKGEQVLRAGADYVVRNPEVIAKVLSAFLV